jgi:hypothetical protein
MLARPEGQARQNFRFQIMDGISSSFIIGQRAVGDGLPAFYGLDFMAQSEFSQNI